MRSESELRGEIKRVLRVLADALEDANAEPEIVADAITTTFVLYAQIVGLSLNQALDEIRAEWTKKN